tara:strand:+ start:28 stop:762 length:735 start_codon:yes stop_codon:yes gene_type:complete
MHKEYSNEDKKNHNKLYFTKKYKKNIDAMLYAFFIDADYENKTPYTILLTNNEIMNMAMNLFTKIKAVTIKFIQDVTNLTEAFKYSINNYIFKEVYNKYKVAINNYIKTLDNIFYNNNKFCNYKVNINSDLFFIPTMIDYLPYYELNMHNKNIDIIYTFPSFNLIFNPKTLKLEFIVKDKKDDIIYYKFTITPEILVDKHNKINKKEFYNNLKCISDFKNKDIDLNHFIVYLDDQKSYLPLIFF